MRMLLALAALVVVAAGLLVFTEPGQGVLRRFGVPAPDCMAARWLYALGYHGGAVALRARISCAAMSVRQLYRAANTRAA